MPLDLIHILLIAVILLASSLLQATIGFASGLLAIPLMLVVGMSLPEAVTVNLIASGIQNVVGAWRLREHVDFKQVTRPSLLRLVTLPLGVYLLHLSGSLAQDQVKQIIGLMILAAVIIQIAWQPQPREKLHQAWEWLAFSLSGVTLGFCGMGGPPMVLWVMAHNWSALRSRAFLFCVFASGVVPQGLLLYLVFGRDILPAALLGLAGIPVAYLGTVWGLYLGHRIPKPTLRTTAYGVLLLIAISAIAAPALT